MASTPATMASEADLDLEAEAAAAGMAEGGRPREKRGETEMSVLKYKLHSLGNKTAERGHGLQELSSDHTSLYAVPPTVARSFTRTYLARATGKLQGMLDKPRQRSTDAVHGEQVERSEGEFRAAARTRMEVHAREQAIYAGRRVGWREKLSHAQVQRGIQARREQEGRKRAPISDASRAAMKRRGRDSDSDGEGSSTQRSASASGGVAASSGTAAAAAAAPGTYLPPPSSSDFFLASLESESAAADALKATLLNEHTVRIHDMIDSHAQSVAHSDSTNSLHPPPTGDGSRPLSGRGLAGGALTKQRKSIIRNTAARVASAGPIGATTHTSAATVAVPAEGDESKDHSGIADSLPSRPPPRSLQFSVSAPVLHTVGPTSAYRSRVPTSRHGTMASSRSRGALVDPNRWKDAHGLHATNMQTSSIALKMVPRLPVHNGLAAEDVAFTSSGPVPANLFIDTHTALEMSCAHVRFSHFRARHKQVHFILLSPDVNYLTLCIFWSVFLTFFQNPRSHPDTPKLQEKLLANIGRKYHELMRFINIHLSLRPDQRLSSWYDQFEGHVLPGSGGAADSTHTDGMSTPLPPSHGHGHAAKRSMPPGMSELSLTTTSTPSGSSSRRSSHAGAVAVTSGGGAGTNRTTPGPQGSAPSFDPFTCVPSYPPDLFPQSLEMSLRPKTRSGVHHARERILLLLPFVISSALFELMTALFPESAHFLTLAFRMRLDGHLHQLLGGIELSEVTLRAQREKYLGSEEEREKRAHPTAAASSSSAGDSSARGAKKDNGDDEDDDAEEGGSSPSSPSRPKRPVSSTRPDASASELREVVSFESLFAFNSLVNARATRGGLKFHEALLDPNHSSVPGSDAVATAARKLARGEKSAPTPLTKHTRLGGVLNQDVTGEAEVESEEEQEQEAAAAAVSSSLTSPLSSPLSPPWTMSPAAEGGSGGTAPPHLALTRQKSSVITSSRAFSAGSSAPAAAAAGSDASADPSAGSAAHALMMATHAASMSLPMSPGFPATPALGLGMGSTGSIDASSSAVTQAQAHQAAQDSKARRRAREKPAKGSLHSTGDWSRDERERRDFLKRMATRHAQGEKIGQKERERANMRAIRLEQEDLGGAAHAGDPVAAGFHALQQQLQLQQQQEQEQSRKGSASGSVGAARAGGSAGYSNNRLSDAILEEGDSESAPPLSAHGFGDIPISPHHQAISSAFESVMQQSMDEVPPTVTLSHGGYSMSALPAMAQLREQAAHSPSEPKRPSSRPSRGNSALSYSASTPALLPTTSPGSANRSALSSRERETPSSPAYSPSLTPMTRHRPSGLSLTLGGGPTPRSRSASHGGGLDQFAAASNGMGPGDHTAQMRARLSASLGSTTCLPLEDDLTHLDTSAVAAGFTASDLTHPLQSMLLAEENARHAQQMRPPTVRIRVNALSSVTSHALEMRNASMGNWGASGAGGRGIVLKHVNPIPRTQMGEDLGDGFAFKPLRVAPVYMDDASVAAAKAEAHAQAQRSQLKLLKEYKALHALQQEEGAVTSRSKAGEHADRMRKSASQPALRPAAKHGAHLAPLQTAAAGGASPSTAANAAAAPAPSASPPTLAPVAHPAGPTQPAPSSKRGSIIQPHSRSANSHGPGAAAGLSLPSTAGSAPPTHDDPSLFLTPRTKEILAQVDAMARDAEEKHKQAQEARQAQAHRGDTEEGGEEVKG